MKELYPLPTNSTALYRSFHGGPDRNNLVIVAGNGNIPLTQEVQQKYLGKRQIITYPCSRFDTGDIKARMGEVRGKDVVIIQGLAKNQNGSSNDFIEEATVMAAAAKDNAAKRVFLIAPYFPGRESRRYEEGMTATVAVFARQLYAAGVEEMFTLDIHDDESQVAVSKWTVGYACKAIAPHLKEKGLKKAVVMAPDEGGLKRAGRLSRRLNGVEHALAITYKRRDPNKPEGSVATGFEGDVKGKIVILYDDMIAGGTTALNGARLAKEHGAKKVLAVASHGLFVKGPDGKTLPEILLDKSCPLDGVKTSNSVDLSGRDDVAEAIIKRKLEIFSIAPIIPVAIFCYAMDGSLYNRLVH